MNKPPPAKMLIEYIQAREARTFELLFERYGEAIRCHIDHMVHGGPAPYIRGAGFVIIDCL